VVLWLAASVLFGLYVANFGSYDKTYGALGGVIVFLVWLWITNAALLFGAEYNATAEPETDTAGTASGEAGEPSAAEVDDSDASKESRAAEADDARRSSGVETDDAQRSSVAKTDDSGGPGEAEGGASGEPGSGRAEKA
jgi:hypothetical protein